MKNYEVRNGNGDPYTVQLDDETAMAMGLKPVDEKAAPAPKDKARSAKNKSA